MYYQNEICLKTMVRKTVTLSLQCCLYINLLARPTYSNEHWNGKLYLRLYLLMQSKTFALPSEWCQFRPFEIESQSASLFLSEIGTKFTLNRVESTRFSLEKELSTSWLFFKRHGGMVFHSLTEQSGRTLNKTVFISPGLIPQEAAKAIASHPLGKYHRFP